MVEHGIEQRVMVYHFHDWCGLLLKTYHIEPPPAGLSYVHTIVKTVVEASAAGRIPKGQYGAVMIDEGHDFEADWLQLVVDCVDPEHDSLLLLYDDAQSIYTKDSNLDFSLSSVGIKARGRTTVLRLNYRNTEEILQFAYRFAKQYLISREEAEDQIPLIVPESAGRHGSEPAVRRFETVEQELEFASKCIESLHDRGMRYADMCIVYRTASQGEAVSKHLKEAGIPIQWLRNKKNKLALNSSDDSVKLMTMHSSKGLEFPFVAIIGVNLLPHKRADEAAEAKLMYVAMTRATENLLITGHSDSGYMLRLAA